MFRLTAPVVIWWIWLVFAVANVIDLGLQAQPRFAAMVSVVLLTITGVAYACAFRPRVVADEGGLLVVNPVRQWRVPWAAIRQIEVRDWVRIKCARAPGGDATKTIECWALFATARVKRNYSRRAQDHITRSADTARMPDEARRLMSLPTVVIIARQLERRAGQAQAHSATDHRATNHRATEEPLVTSWAWPSIAAMLLPARSPGHLLLTTPLTPAARVTARRRGPANRALRWSRATPMARSGSDHPSAPVARRAGYQVPMVQTESCSLISTAG